MMSFLIFPILVEILNLAFMTLNKCFFNFKGPLSIVQFKTHVGSVCVEET